MDYQRQALINESNPSAADLFTFFRENRPCMIHVYGILNLTMPSVTNVDPFSFTVNLYCLRTQTLISCFILVLEECDIQYCSAQIWNLLCNDPVYFHPIQTMDLRKDL